MSALVQRLEAKQVSFQVLQHVRTTGARQEARALGLYPGIVVKAVLLDTRAGHAVAVLPASRKLDLTLLRRAVCDPEASIASEQEIIHDFPEYPLGALPPFESMMHLPVYVDPEVLEHDSVVVAVSATESVRARTEEMFSGEWVTIQALSRAGNRPPCVA